MGLAALAVAAAVECHDLPPRSRKRIDDPRPAPVSTKAAREAMDEGYGRTAPFHDVVDGYAASLECRHRTLPIRSSDLDETKCQDTLPCTAVRTPAAAA